MNERQKLGRLEKLLGNFQKNFFLQKVKNSADIIFNYEFYYWKY